MNEECARRFADAEVVRATAHRTNGFAGFFAVGNLRAQRLDEAGSRQESIHGQQPSRRDSEYEKPQISRLG